MEQGYLVDTNVVIDYLENMLPIKSIELIDVIHIQLSVITRIELLAWPKATFAQLNMLKGFINTCTVYTLEEPIILKAIEIRRNDRL